MYILKFGGTSVGSAESIKTVLKIVQEQQKMDVEILVVVSAFSGITNQLLQISELAELRDPQYQDDLEKVRSRHKQIISELFGKKAAETEELIMPLILELAEIVHGIFLLRECSPRTNDLLLSFGERLSATIINLYFQNNKIDSVYCDARKVIITDDQYGGARINFDQTNKNIVQCIDTQKVNIVTGFISGTQQGVTTTLGRGGSDYTAAVFAAALGAKEIQIWTDVNGVMTTNPAMVPSAFPLAYLTYEEAMELSHFGAKVLHPPTIQPALEKNIPIRILNTFDRSFSGTVIHSEANEKDHVITGLTAIDKIALITIQGSGLVGVPGIAARLFQALAQKEINVIMITQASSEHSICVAVSPDQSNPARKAIENEFRHEIKAHEMDTIEVEKDLSVIAVVGQNMRRVPGIAGSLFNALGSAGINVVAVTQGSSELNISVVVQNSEQKKALNVIHNAFYKTEEDKKTLDIFLAGPGLIGSELLRQIRTLKNISIRVNGIINSKKMLLKKDIDLSAWQKEFKKAESYSGINEFVKNIIQGKTEKTVFVDCTASEQVAAVYLRLLQNGISVVTANKIANTQSFEQFARLQKYASGKGAYYYYETNVGAALPVIETLKMLVRGGDEVKSIEAILSGSLSYIFNTFKPGLSFSGIVKKAQEMGYTEPDPRTDLSGMDVARKILILARECGVKMELKDITIKSFLPKKCLQAKSVEDFFLELEKNDDSFDQLLKDTINEGKLLRYIAAFKSRSIHIQLQAVDQNHPFYNLNESDNVVSFRTKRYDKTPLVIKGPGAGAELTAGGVLADILKIN